MTTPEISSISLLHPLFKDLLESLEPNAKKQEMLVKVHRTLTYPSQVTIKRMLVNQL